MMGFVLAKRRFTVTYVIFIYTYYLLEVDVKVTPHPYTHNNILLIRKQYVIGLFYRYASISSYTKNRKF